MKEKLIGVFQEVCPDSGFPLRTIDPLVYNVEADLTGHDTPHTWIKEGVTRALVKDVQRQASDGLSKDSGFERKLKLLLLFRGDVALDVRE